MPPACCSPVLWCSCGLHPRNEYRGQVRSVLGGLSGAHPWRTLRPERCGENEDHDASCLFNITVDAMMVMVMVMVMVILVVVILVMVGMT